MNKATATVKYERVYGNFKLTFETTNGIHVDVVINRADAVKLRNYLENNLSE